MPSAVPQRTWPGLVRTRVWFAQSVISTDLEMEAFRPVYDLRFADDALPPLPQGEPPLPQGFVRVVIYYEYNDMEEQIVTYPDPYIA